MPVYEQGAMDSLHAAKRAIERAIEKCPGQELSLDSGDLFATLDNIDTAEAELKDARRTT